MEFLKCVDQSNLGKIFFMHSGVSFEVSDRYSDLKVIGQGTVIFSF
jgi:hypothetical protein